MPHLWTILNEALQTLKTLVNIGECVIKKKENFDLKVVMFKLIDNQPKMCVGIYDFTIKIYMNDSHHKGQNHVGIYILFQR